ncbi:anthrone oxygenase family protein [Streptomyces sp. NPDC002889]|uniref:anthrone oxygenase family protein n=1 Tax=Streptomyces sp. NPDC002889 TaxID=3364669 RepID=UPI0036B14AFB
MIAYLVPAVVLVNGLAAGVLFGTQLGGWPLLAALPADRYVHAHAFFATRYDPAMPLCLLGTLIGDAVLAVVAPDAAVRALFIAAAVLAAATVTISLTKNVPVNKWVQTLDPDNLPDDFEANDPRWNWGAWNQRRSVLTLCALLANCLALALLL